MVSFTKGGAMADWNRELGERVERVEQKVDDLATSVARRFAEFSEALAEGRRYTEFAFARLEGRFDAWPARALPGIGSGVRGPRVPCSDEPPTNRCNPRFTLTDDSGQTAGIRPRDEPGQRRYNFPSLYFLRRGSFERVLI